MKLYFLSLFVIFFGIQGLAQNQNQTTNQDDPYKVYVFGTVEKPNTEILSGKISQPLYVCASTDKPESTRFQVNDVTYVKNGRPTDHGYYQIYLLDSSGRPLAGPALKISNRYLFSIQLTNHVGYSADEEGVYFYVRDIQHRSVFGPKGKVIQIPDGVFDLYVDSKTGETKYFQADLTLPNYRGGRVHVSTAGDNSYKCQFVSTHL